MEDFSVLGVKGTGQIVNPQAVTAGLAASVLRALLHSVSNRRLKLFKQVREELTLEQLAVLAKTHDGTFGLSFEYAIHHGINSETAPLYDYIRGALRRRYGWEFPIRSVLAGTEKRSYTHLIDNHEELLGEGAKLVLPSDEIEITADLLRALRSSKERKKLPDSCFGLFKTDLLVGSRDAKVWTTVSLKTNRDFLDPLPAISLMVFPYERNRIRVRNENDAVLGALCRSDYSSSTLLPVPTDGAFMEQLHVVFHVVIAMINQDMKEPKSRHYPEAGRIGLARFLFEHRKRKASEVIEMLTNIANPVGHREILMPNPPTLVTDPAEIRAYLPDELGADVRFTSMPGYLTNPVLDDLLLDRKAA